MTRILFLSERNDTLGPMAEALARGLRGGACEIVGAGLSANTIHPVAVRVMGEIGIDLSGYAARKLSDGVTKEFDLVVTLTDNTTPEYGPLFPRCPHRLRWELADPAGIEGDRKEVLAAFRNARDTLKRLTNDLFEKGYFDTLMQATRFRDAITNGMSDALLIHDLHRTIALFNPAAERLTGYSQDNVLDRDCHAVFAGHLCGGKCLLPNGPCEIRESVREAIGIAHKDGSPVAVERSVRRLENARGEVIGAVVLFRDRTREQRLAQRVRETQCFAGIVGKDEKMTEIYDLIRDLAESNVPVLIQGESGTGKELVAAAMHNEGPRAAKLFVPVNCGSLPETLLESELFGHVRGAFTGAIRDKKGRFELADGGTIFLDEIGDISPPMQVKLLRVLQEGEFVRVGSEETVKVNVRVVSATNKNLTEEIAAGRFREDLYYRLSVMPIWIPPLRERHADIPLLAEHILEKLRKETGRIGVTISPDAMNVMISHTWPGNVRELQNWIQFAMVKCKGGEIKPEHLPSPGTAGTTPPKTLRGKKLGRETVLLAIEHASGNKKKAAAILGVSRATLYRSLA